MNTDDFIDLLSQDAAVQRGIRGIFVRFMLLGLLSSIYLSIATMGARPDILDAAQTVGFMVKVGMTSAIAFQTCILVFKIGRPGVPISPSIIRIAMLVALFMISISINLLAQSPDQASLNKLTAYTGYCIFFAVILSLPPLAGLLEALRRGAPAHPGSAGAAAGLAAGSIGAAIYNWSCPYDSPVFIGVWYLTAIWVLPHFV